MRQPLEQRREVRTVLPAARRDTAEREPLGVIAHREGDPFVDAGAAVHAVRSHPGVRVPGTDGDLTRQLVLDALLPDEGDASLVLGELDERPFARPRALLERG